MLLLGSFLSIVVIVVSFAIYAAVVSGDDSTRWARGWRACFVAAVWLALSGAPTAVGLVREGGPVPPQVLFAVFLGGALYLAMGGWGRTVARHVPLYALVGFQGFRLPLELVLHEWAGQGLVPGQMTWTGQNWDIVAGALALVSIPFVRWRPRLAWIPTVVGAVLLANVLRVVVASLPGPLQRFPDPILLAFRFPHVWIASVCVAGAVAGHVIAFRALLGISRKGERE